MLDLELLEKVYVFFLKCLFAVMLFLIQNIVIYIFYLRMTVRESPVPFLSVEFSLYPFVFVYEVGRIVFNIADDV